MITNISLVSVFVKDIDASKAFYLDVLGFEEHTDITLGDGYRWCTVKHPSQPELQVHLTRPGPPYSPEMVDGDQPRARRGRHERPRPARRRLPEDLRGARAKGVEFLQEPEERPYGVEASAATTPATGWCWSSRGVLRPGRLRHATPGRRGATGRIAAMTDPNELWDFDDPAGSEAAVPGRGRDRRGDRPAGAADPGGAGARAAGAVRRGARRPRRPRSRPRGGDPGRARARPAAALGR